MELNINSPSYYKDHYGIDDEVYRFCQRAYTFFKDKKYSNTLQIIGIVPIVAPQEIYDSGKYKEEIKFLNKKSLASIIIKIDFNNYHNASSTEKIDLTKEMILKAVKLIKRKVDFVLFCALKSRDKSVDVVRGKNIRIAVAKMHK